MKYNGYKASFNENTCEIAIVSPEGVVVKVLASNEYAGELKYANKDTLIDSLLGDSGYTVEELGIK